MTDKIDKKIHKLVGKWMDSEVWKEEREEEDYDKAKIKSDFKEKSYGI